jgi:predicted DCC family thiol-disulfide oxidoreductase YuxK
VNAPRKPRLIFDGDCHFCRRWIERWREITGERVDYVSSQEGAPDHPDIPLEDFDRAVQWVGADGHRESGAAAVLSALATGGFAGRALLALYRTAPPFAWAADTGYRMVANHRTAFSRLTRWLWGNDVRTPTYATATWIFLRLLGLIYLIAFASFWWQSAGLIGPSGILPAETFFARMHASLGDDAFRQFPSLLWAGAGPTALAIWCALGVLASLLLLLGILPAPSLIFLWAGYLSLTMAGQVFYQFQWDFLLLEVGFLAIFLSPWQWWTPWKTRSSPPRLAHFLLLWLLFRLMVASAVVKLSSGDPSWADGSALDYHYFTQPLPTPLAWYAQQLPSGCQWLSVKGMFFIEIVLPVLLFLPRRPRLVAAAGLAALQVLITLTGNYGFFNLLTLALCLLAVDDHVFGSRRPDGKKAGTLPGWLLAPPTAALFLVSLIPFAQAFRPRTIWFKQEYDEHVAPFRTINGYGLFAVMTRERPEILVQGSLDGLTWKTYSFRYKPGDPDRPPPWVAPYMPRLDWQMWFAALGRIEHNPWFVHFLQRLLEGSPEVLALLAEDPFAGQRPRFVRAKLDLYTFTTFGDHAKAWWRVEPAGMYCPEVSLRPR